MSKTDFTIRPMVESDLDAVLDNEREADRRFAEIGMTWVAIDDWPSREQLSTYLAAEQAWVAELAGTVVGEVMVSVIDGHTHLDQLTVGYAWGRRGIGQALIETAEAWARNRLDEIITLTTSRDVPWNRPWYERLGYRVLAADERGSQLAAQYEFERQFFGDNPSVTMVKELRAVSGR